MAIEKLKGLFSSWCVWRLEPKPETPYKSAKIPINPNTGKWAKTNSPATFGTYDEAQAAFTGGGFQGLGALLSSGGDTIIIDIDNVIDVDGNPAQLAQSAFEILHGAYCEISQSNRGLHFILRGRLPDWCKREKVNVDGHSVEVYSRESVRFMALTGNEVQEADVVENQAALEVFLRKCGFDAEAKAPGAARISSATGDADNDADADADSVRHDDAEIFALMLRSKKRAKISRLLAGDLKDYDADHSKADLGLCSEIAYYTKDPDQVASIFEQSELSKRDKWKKRADYRESTIDKAIAGATGDYFDQSKAVGATKLATGSALAQYGDKLQGGAGDLQAIRGGQLASTIENGIQVLLRDFRTQGTIAFNIFSAEVYVLRPLCEVFSAAASNRTGAFDEGDITFIRAWFGREYRMSFPLEDALAVVVAWSKCVKFNPITEALDKAALGWDGKPRLTTWLADYMKVDVSEMPEYHSAIGRKFLIGAVARAYAPGCKMDNMLVFEGAQGAGKSRAIRVIGEALWPDAFTETVPVLRESTKETAMHLRGIHIAEMQELTSLKKADAEVIKGFITTANDRLRLPFAKSPTSWGRTSVLIGSTNQSTYVQDESGGRRFWGCVVGVTGNIDVDRLRTDILQLYGEAVVAFRAGERWDIPREDVDLMRQAQTQQTRRQLGDSWDDNVSAFIARTFTTYESLTVRYKLAELYDGVFPSAKMKTNGQDFDRLTQMRFSSCLKRAGFERKTSNGAYWLLAGDAAQRVRGEIKDFGPMIPGQSVLKKPGSLLTRAAMTCAQVH